MNDAQSAELAAWIAEAGLAGESETVLLGGFCERAVAFGMPLARAMVIIDTLHPIYEGRMFGWNAADGETEQREYGPTNEGEALERWRNSPF
jgi:adenylate cyclase